MRDEWDVRSLGDFSEIKYGYTAKANSEPVGPKFLRITDIQNGDVDWEAVPFCEVSLRDQERHRLQSGDLVFARTGATTGKSFLIHQPPESVCASYLIRVRPDQAVVLPSFLNVYFQTADYWDAIAAGTEGAAQGGFNASKLSALLIPLPPLEEQRRIVAVLDEAFEGLARARANAEANLQNARELFEAIKSAALREAQSNGQIMSLADVTAITSGLVDPKEEEYADLPHLGAGNMLTGSDQLVDVLTAREEKLISGKYLFEAGVVLYSKIRPYLRKAARPDFDGLCSADVYPLTPNSKLLNRDFLFHVLLSDDFTNYAIQGSGRAGMPKVNRRHLFAYKFALPALDAQARAVEVIEAAKQRCDQLVENAEGKLDDLDDLRQSLLQQAFAGELL